MACGEPHAERIDQIQVSRILRCGNKRSRVLVHRKDFQDTHFLGLRLHTSRVKCAEAALVIRLEKKDPPAGCGKIVQFDFCNPAKYRARYFPAQCLIGIGCRGNDKFRRLDPFENLYDLDIELACGRFHIGDHHQVGVCNHFSEAKRSIVVGM